MKKIAFFDFDGTITTKDTLLEIIKFQKGTIPFYFGFLLNSPFLIAFKIGLISNQTAKERILTYFFGKTPVDQFQNECDRFAEEDLGKLIRPKAILEIQTLKEKGFEVVIVSASASPWLTAWTKRHQLKLIATELEVRSQKITGRISGKNCHGLEKVNRIRQQYVLEEYGEVYCYGDTSGDIPMLQISTRSFFKPFR